MDPNFSYAHLYLGSIYLQKSMYEEAMTEFQKEKEISRGWGLQLEPWIGIAYMKMGQKDKTQEILDELIKKSQQQYIPSSLLAMLCFALEEDDQGFQFLEMAYEQYDSFLGKIKIEPPFDRIRSDPRFKSLLDKIGME